MPSPGINVIVWVITFIIIARLQPPGLDELDAIAAHVLASLSDREPSPTDLAFLLRHYRASDREDVGDALGEALAVGLTKYALDPSVQRRAEWLLLFRDAIDLSDDERLQPAVSVLIASLARDMPSLTQVVDACTSIDACLRAADLGDAADIISCAVDELERVVGRAYKPGDGMVDGDFFDHVRAAAALLTAYQVTGRLPYAMLAEELMQSARRFPLETSGCAASCEAVRGFCRLAALHADEEYRGAAVIAADADYRDDAARLLASQAPHAKGTDAALYGLALGEYLALTIESPDAYGH